MSKPCPYQHFCPQCFSDSDELAASERSYFAQAVAHHWRATAEVYFQSQFAPGSTSKVGARLQALRTREKQLLAEIQELVVPFLPGAVDNNSGLLRGLKDLNSRTAFCNSNRALKRTLISIATIQSKGNFSSQFQVYRQQQFEFLLSRLFNSTDQPQQSMDQNSDQALPAQSLTEELETPSDSVENQQQTPPLLFDDGAAIDDVMDAAPSSSSVPDLVTLESSHMTHDNDDDMDNTFDDIDALVELDASRDEDEEDFSGWGVCQTTGSGKNILYNFYDSLVGINGSGETASTCSTSKERRHGLSESAASMLCAIYLNGQLTDSQMRIISSAFQAIYTGSFRF